MQEDASVQITMETHMGYLRMTKVPRLYPGKRHFERRIDARTAQDIDDALRADSVKAAALAMEHLQVDVDVALRVLAGDEDRGKQRRQADQDLPAAA
jgi:Arc/MetJ family transcription regulator